MAGLFKWGGRKEEGAATTALSAKPVEEPRRSTKVLPRFLSVVAAVEAPVLLNLGPVIGQNVSFLGERLSCKIFVEDLLEEVDAAVCVDVAAGELEALFERRLAHAPGSIDGILCWDLFDFLDRPASQALARRLVELVRPGGVLHAFFATTPATVAHHTRYIVEEPDLFALRTAPAAARTRHVIVTRDITRMFDGLTVVESVLLKSGAQETLFRKPV